MPDYQETLELTGMDEDSFSYGDYKRAVKLTERKSPDEGYREVLFPYVIRDMLIARCIRGRAEEVRTCRNFR